MIRAETKKVSVLLFFAVMISMCNVSFVHAASGCEVKYTNTASWETGFTGKIEIVNNSGRELDQWKLDFDWDSKITAIWNARLEKCDNNHYIISSEFWNETIPAGGTLTFGFLGTNGQSKSDPAGFVVRDIYDELSLKDSEWQNYIEGIQRAAFQKSWAEGLVTVSTSFESKEPFRIGYEIIKKNPVERFIQAAYQNVEIPTKDGIKLKGIFFPVSNAKGTIIMLHGYGSTALWEVPKLKFLLDHGYQILAYNSRCWNYYLNPEKYTGLLSKDLEDIGSALDYLKGRYDVDRNKIGIYGFSYGANKALLETALRSDVKVLISDGATQNIPTYSQYFTWDKIGQEFINIYEQRYGAGTMSMGINLFPSVFTNAAALITKPVLFIHGLNDTEVPTEDAEALYNAANVPKEKIILSQSGHCNGDLTADKTVYESSVLQFLETYLN